MLMNQIVGAQQAWIQILLEFLDQIDIFFQLKYWEKHIAHFNLERYAAIFILVVQVADVELFCCASRWCWNLSVQSLLITKYFIYF